jgi:hypothetical protein
MHAPSPMTEPPPPDQTFLVLFAQTGDRKASVSREPAVFRPWTL